MLLVFVSNRDNSVRFSLVWLGCSWLFNRLAADLRRKLHLDGGEISF